MFEDLGLAVFLRCLFTATAVCSLLPSLSPDYRARLVEATKQIAATGLSQSRLDSLILRHAGPGGSANEESSQSPAGGVNRSNDGPSETAGMTASSSCKFPHLELAPSFESSPF